jgi:hypothetical protein
VSLPSSYRSRRGHIHLPRVLPLIGCWSKTPIAGAPGRDLAEDLMANSTASIFIKPTVASNRGDTFVFGSWVCTADGASSFQRRLTMTPNPKTKLVTLPEVITGTLAGKFGEISLYNQHTDFESGSASNSNSTSPWVIACEPATEPSCEHTPLHEHFLYGLCNASRPTRKLSPHAGLARRSSLTTLRTPTPPPATTQTPLTSSTSGRTLSSPNSRSSRSSNRCQAQPPAWL